MKQNYPPPSQRSAIFRFLNGILLGAVLLLGAAQASAQATMTCSVIGNTNPGVVRPGGPAAPGIVTAACNDLQYVRVNVHFLQRDNGTGNFGPSGDNHPQTPGPMTGYDYAQGLISNCNAQMGGNPVLNLAPGSALTPVAKRIRWVLDGVFFDKSTTYRNGANNPNASPPSPSHDYQPLCIRADSVINIFLVEELAWPLVGLFGNTTGSPFASPGTRGYVYAYNQARCDINPTPSALWAVVSSPWTQHVIGGGNPWMIASAVNHELCHLLGLNHPHEYNSFNWGECPDAPANENCWNINMMNPDCDTQAKVSNNLMDTNAFQSSLAPCQIDIMQANLNTCLQSRYVYKCGTCPPTTATFTTSVERDCMPTPIWLDSRAAGSYHWYKLEIDRLNTSGTAIAGTHYENMVFEPVQPAVNSLFPLNRRDLNEFYSFAAGFAYRVKLTTGAYCGTTAVRVQTLTTPPCISAGDPAGRMATTTGSTPTVISPRP